jgi:VIT1/CCC1 family predicted Fe2+/Mn2+ transporter
MLGQLATERAVLTSDMSSSHAHAAMFSPGAAMPFLMVVLSPASALILVVAAASLGFLALLGAIGAQRSA